MKLVATDRHQQYLNKIESQLKDLYTLAIKARSKGVDPSLEPETHMVKDLAEMVESLVGPPNVAERIRELSKKTDKYKMAFIVSEDIVHARFGHTNLQESAEQALKTALAIMTGGITAAPIQGISSVTIKNNLDKTQYLAIYFAGPIRSAAGTEQALTLVLGDFIRKRLGLDRYKPTDAEINRFIEEVRLYEREVGRFQFKVTDDELFNTIMHLPVEVTGTETDPYEVAFYRNLPRIKTNRLRGGALRVVNDGLVGRKAKILKIVEKLGIHGWDWLKEIKSEESEEKEQKGRTRGLAVNML